MPIISLFLMDPLSWQ